MKWLFGVIVVSLIILAGCSKTTPTQNYDSLAQCMTTAGAVMYGTTWCPHCQDQKAEFGNSFKYINFVDCDAHTDECNAANVTGYPTWVINSTYYEGTQNIYDLAKYSGCVAALENAT